MGDRNLGAWEVLTPVPADAPGAPTEHYRLGKPAAIWTYRGAGAAVLGYVHRYDLPDGGKAFYPLTWCQHSYDGRTLWRWKAWPPLRPLYRLDQLLELPDAPVIILEGEKAADAASELLPDHISITSPNGSNAAGKADWLPLAQRQITIWPDADEAGAKYAADVARALFALGVVEVKIVTPPKGVASGWAADAAADGWTAAQALALVEEASPALREAHGSPKRPPADGPVSEKSQKGATRWRGPPQRDRLIKLVEGLDFWHSNEGECYATIEVDEHNETWRLKAREFKSWLAGRYYDATGCAPGSQALGDALNVLDRMAVLGREHTPYLRVGAADGAVYLDLGGRDWRAVEVTSEGWRLVDKAPVKFVRSPSTEVLPEPEAGASVDTFRGFVNVETDADFTLMIAFAVGALNPSGPYPILLVNGEQGTAKSTMAKMLAGLIDPRACPLRALPRDERDLAIAGRNSYVIAFDNVSGLPNAISDALCRMASGGGFVTRELHSDDAEIIFKAQRPIILNGIPDLASRSDLSDRAIHITLAPIARGARRTERELFASYEDARPAILGALLDGVSSAIRNHDKVEPDRVERMADFAQWIRAAEPGLGWEAGTFSEAKDANRAGAVERTVEGDAVASALVNLVERVTLPWEGSATELLAELDAGVNEKVRASRAWPAAASHLSNRLRRCAPALRALGIEVDLGGRAATKDRKRLIVIRRGE